MAATKTTPEGLSRTLFYLTLAGVVAFVAASLLFVP